MSFFPRSTAVAYAFTLAVGFGALSLAGPARAGLGVGPTSPIDPVRFPAVRNQDQVAAADNGSVTLYAWRDTRRGGSDIFGARVKHDGTVLDPNGIELAGGSGDESEPALSWDGTQWLLAWNDGGEVKVQRVSATGALPDIPTTLSTGGSTASHPALAWNGSVHVAVWAELAAGVSKVFAASIDDNGSVLAAGAALSLGTSDAAPAIAALGSDALVTFDAGSDIHGVRVKAALPLGAIVRLDALDLVIVSEANGQSESAVAASGSNWLVAWEDGRNANAIDIRGTRVSAAGAVLDGTSILVSGESRATGLALAHDGSQWLASWQGGSDGIGQKLRAIANNGNPGNTTVVVSASPGPSAFGGAPANPTIAWSDATAGEKDLLGRRIGASLALDPAFTIATQTPNQTEPSHAFGAGRWMIAWVDDRFGSDQRQVRVGLTDSARFEPPNPATVTFAVPRVGNDQGHPSLVYDGTNFNLFWDEERGGRRIVCGARFTAGGAPLDTFTVAGGAWNQYEPSAVAKQNDEVFVAWTDSRLNATERDLWAAVLKNGAFVQAEGAIAATAGLREEHPAAAEPQGYVVVAFESSSPDVPKGIEMVEVFNPLVVGLPYRITVQRAAGKVYERPRIADNGEDALIAYQEVVFSDGPSLHIPYGRRYREDAQDVHFTQFAFGPGSYTPANPVIGSAGYDFVPVWSSRATGDVDVVVTAVDPNGEPVLPAAIPLTADAVIDTPGDCEQGLGDRVGLSYMRSLSDSTWSGLQLYGGEAQDTLAGKVVLNEFLAHPYDSSPTGEFYELFNVSGRSFLLNGWTLHIDGQSNVVADCNIIFKARKDGRETHASEPTRPDGTPCSQIDDQNFFTDDAFEDFEFDPVQGYLPDRGAVLELFSPGGVLVDRVGYGYRGGAPVSGAIPIGIAPAAKTPPGASTFAAGDSVDLSTNRIPNGNDTDNDANDWNTSATTTPNNANVGTAAQLGTALFVSRAYWNPSTGEPTVEFLNPSTNQTFDFAGWYLSNNVSTERIGLNTNAFSQMKPLETRLLRRAETGSFTFRMDELSVLYLYDPNFVRYEQLGWSRADQIAPDMCVTRFQGTGGTHDGFDWLSSGGREDISTGELRYTTCSIQSPTTDVPPSVSRLAFGGMWPNPSRASQQPLIVFTVPGTTGGARVHARLSLYDVAGRRVSTLIDADFAPGEQRVPLSRMDREHRVLRAGTYYADLEIAGQKVRRTMVFLD
jgi:hypothetical protein